MEQSCALNEKPLRNSSSSSAPPVVSFYEPEMCDLETSRQLKAPVATYFQQVSFHVLLAKRSVNVSDFVDSFWHRVEQLTTL